MIKKADMSNHCDGKRYRSFMFADVHQADAASGRLCRWLFKSNVRETWRVILVSKADIFHTESLRILAERLSQSEIGLPLRQICYYSPPNDNIINLRLDITHLYYPAKNSFQKSRLKRREIFTELLLYTLTT